MTSFPSYFIWIFTIAALLFSLFYGFKAREIFLETSTVNKPFAWKMHQFWFNFLGSLTGWIILWCVLPKISLIFKPSKDLDFTLSDGLLILLSFIGITGHLPVTIWGVINSAKELVSKLFNGK